VLGLLYEKKQIMKLPTDNFRETYFRATFFLGGRHFLVGFAVDTFPVNITNQKIFNNKFLKLCKFNVKTKVNNKNSAKTSLLYHIYYLEIFYFACKCSKLLQIEYFERIFCNTFFQHSISCTDKL
jgi:hypothetical protein